MSSSSQLPGAAAPLPSPTSSNDQTQYFAALHPQHQHPLQGQPGAVHNPSALTVTDEQHPKIQKSSSSDSSDSSVQNGSFDYLKESTLLAEAAKRAEMAVVARDLGDVQL